MKFVLIIFIVYIIIYIKKNNIRIKFDTFLKKGFKVNQGAYGVYCYVGKQGSGKTYSVIEYLFNNRDCKIYSNVKSIKNLRYTYIATFDDLLNIENDTDENIIIFYDEIFSALTRNDKMSKEVLSFLSQMRKRKIIFLTTAQEWLEINITLRRYVRFQIDCSIKNFFGKSFLFKVFHDGDLIHWDSLSNDYVSPVLETSISKMNTCISENYDTFEVIQSSNQQLSKKKTSREMCFLESTSPGGEIGGDKVNHDTTTISDSLVNGQDTDFWGKDTFERKDFDE